MSRVKTVRVSCEGETMQSHKVKEFCIYNVPDTHDIFTKGELSELSNRIGIPILVFKMRPSMIVEPQGHYYGCWRRSAHGYGYKDNEKFFPNPVATALMSGNTTGQTDWFDRVGSVLIARADKKPLEMSHLHIMLGFLNEATYKASTRSVDEAIKMLIPATFKEYYMSFADYFKSQTIDEDWVDRSPWDDDKMIEDKTAEQQSDEDEIL